MEILCVMTERKDMPRRHHLSYTNSPKLTRRRRQDRHIVEVGIYQVVDCSCALLPSKCDQMYDFLLDRQLSLRPTQEELEEKNILHSKYHLRYLCLLIIILIKSLIVSSLLICMFNHKLMVCLVFNFNSVNHTYLQHV